MSCSVCDSSTLEETGKIAYMYGVCVHNRLRDTLILVDHCLARQVREFCIPRHICMVVNRQIPTCVFPP